MSTFLIVLAVILGGCADVGLFCLAVWLADNRKAYRLAAAAAVATVLLAALMITWGVRNNDSDSGRCGAGTTRVVYHQGKTTTAVCERTLQ